MSGGDFLSSAAVTRRAFLVGGAMTLTAAGAYAAQPRRAEHRLATHKLGELVPTAIGPWIVTTPVGVIRAVEEAQDTQGYDQLLTRVYRAPGLPTVMLLIAYGSTQGGTLQVHRPETCYPGQGFRLSDFQDAEYSFPGVSDVSARRFTARRDDRVERLVYWTRIARSFPRNTAGEYAAIIGSVLRGVVPDGVLVRFSTTDADGTAADRALDEFATLTLNKTNDLGRKVLLGTA